MSIYNLHFDQKYEKYPKFYLKIFIFWWLKYSVYLNRHVFEMLLGPWLLANSHWILITKTYLYNFDPLKPHFYIVKLGFTGVGIIFLISAQKHRLWVLIRAPCQGGSKEYPQSMFWSEIWKILEFLSENFQFLVVNIFNIFE